MNYRFIILAVLVCAALLGMQDVFSQTTGETFDPSSLIDPDTGLPLGFDEQLSVVQIPKIPKLPGLKMVRSFFLK
jgi:hypothetical protein